MPIKRAPTVAQFRVMCYKFLVELVDEIDRDAELVTELWCNNETKEMYIVNKNEEGNICSVRLSEGQMR